MLTYTSYLAGQGSTAIRSLIEQFAETVLRPDFPCIYAGVPFLEDELLFNESHSVADGVETFRHFADRISQSKNLICVTFFTPFVDACPSGLDEDFAFASALMHEVVSSEAVHGSDASVPLEVDSEFWALRLSGVDLFVNFSSPNHLRRRSRNVGGALTAIVQSRSSFNDKNRSNDRARRAIRERLAVYDDVPAHPSLGTFGTPGNREALQYFLGDDERPWNIMTSEGLEERGCGERR